jgi:hypothetical protein
VLAVAAIRATVRELRGERGWEKTDHVGAHRSVLQLDEDEFTIHDLDESVLDESTDVGASRGPSTGPLPLSGSAR